MHLNYNRYVIYFAVIVCLLIQTSVFSRTTQMDKSNTYNQEQVTLKDAYSLSNLGDPLYQLKVTLTTKSSQASASEGIVSVIDIENRGQETISFVNPLDLMYFNLYNVKGEALPLPQVTSRLTTRTGHAPGMEKIPDPLRLSFRVLGGSLGRKVLGQVGVNEYVFRLAPQEHLQLAVSVDRIQGQVFASDPSTPTVPKFDPPQDVPLPPGIYQFQVGVELTPPNASGNYRRLLSPIVKVDSRQGTTGANKHLPDSNEATDPILEVLDGGGTERFALEYSQYDFGKVLSTDVQPVRHTFLVKNVSEEPIMIERIATSCGCTEAFIGEEQPRDLPFRLKPHEVIKVNAAFNPHAEAPGNINKYIWLFGRQHTQVSATMALIGTVTPVK